MTARQTPVRAYAPGGTAAPIRRWVGAVVGACGVLAALLVPARLAAQGRPVSPDSARIRDSVIAAILADTTDAELDAVLTELLRPPTRRTLVIRPIRRRYTVGDVVATENVATTTLAIRGHRWALRGEITPLTYTAGGGTVSGATPVQLRGDLRLRQRDSLRLTLQSASVPATLTSVEAAAIGAVGTGTLDLDAFALPGTARATLRYVTRLTADDDGRTALLLRGGVEIEPRPSGVGQVFWRGTTVRGAVGVEHRTGTGDADSWLLTGLAEAVRSTADSLGGRNLFPGGGSLSLEGRAGRAFGTDGLGHVTVSAFWARPIGLERPDQPTRLIPIGNVAGLNVSAIVPMGRVTWLPVLGVIREASSASAITRSPTPGRPPTQSSLDASGTTASLGLGLSIPLGGRLTLTPEVGTVVGTVGQTVTEGVVFPRRIVGNTVSFDDAIRGGWFGLELAVRW